MSGPAATLAARGWRRVWVLDTEYKSVEGGLQIPHCLCALDLISRERRDLWLEPGAPCPFLMAKDELFVLYAADADILTFIAMPDWPTPLNVIDPRIEWMAEEWPLAGELRRFRTLLDQLKTFDLLIGQDGRARAHLRPFGTKSSRNNTAKGGGFIFALNSVFRHLIQAPRGRALIAVDWSAQELHIAARLSRDPKLIEIVTSGRDPYVELAITVDHALAQRADGLVEHREDSCLAWG